MIERLSHNEVLTFLVQISLLLISARVFGEIFKRLRQPAVIGEILAGIILGPSLLGKVYPEGFNDLFLAHPKATLAFNGLASVGVIFLLFIAGMEVDLPMIWKHGKSALFISLSGIVVPIILGITSGYFFFDFFSDKPPDHKLIFALFFGVALSISALPVIAKILIDLNLIRTKVGGLILASAMIDDILGWVMFSVILTLMDSTKSISAVPYTLAFTLFFTILILTLGRFFINKLLPLFNKYISGQSGVITFAISMCFLGAVFTEYIGIHSVFGAFLMGIAFGDSEHFTEKARTVINQFIINIFAPLFFVSIGLRINFVENFDPWIILVVLVLSYLSKVVGVGFGAHMSGLEKSEALAISFGMNARGMMEIVLGLLAFEAGIIDERMLVALVIMALLTSMTSGPLMKFFLQRGPKAETPSTT